MAAALAARLSRFLVGCHPRRWRQRYADEMLDVLEQQVRGWEANPVAKVVQ